MVDYAFARDEIMQLVRDIADGGCDKLEADGRIGWLTTDELRDTLVEYGRTVLPLSDELYDAADWFEIEGEKDLWSVDVPMLTKEEGRSDLTLQLQVKLENGDVLVRIEALHVL